MFVAHAEQLGKLQVQLKAQTEASSKQSKEFNESLKKMQETNSGLQASMTKMTNELMASKQRVTELESHKPSNTGYIVAIIVLIILAIIGLVT